MMGAVNRAAEGGAMPPEAPMAPEGEAGGGMEMLAQGMQAIKALIEAQVQQGNPAAEQASMAFQGLVEAMKSMVGGGAEQPPIPPEAAPAESGPVPLQGQGATVLS